MDLAPVLTRLKSQLVGFKLIGSGADLEAIGNGFVPNPSCYLVPTSESAEDNLLIGAFEQRLTVGFSIILAVANQSDVTGAAALVDLQTLRQQIKASIVAWAPDPVIGEPVHFASGSLLRFGDGLLWWADEFRVVTYERMP